MRVLARKHYRIQSWMFLGVLPGHNSAELRNSLELVNLRAALNKSVISAVVVLQQAMWQIFAQAQ
jgi:hypothetical protein